MSVEKYPGMENREHVTDYTEENQEQQKRSAEKISSGPEKSIDIDEIRRSIENRATPTEQIIDASSSHKEEAAPAQAHVTRELNEMAYARLLTRARKQLPIYDRAISRVIHAPGIDAASEVVSRTVGRPSGILGGGILASLGTLAYYFVARHYGYDYNFFAFLLLLVVGIAIGWLLEISWKVLKKSSHGN